MGRISIIVNVKMSLCKEPLCEKNKKLALIGSQINLTPRSDHYVFGSFHTKSCRLCSPRSQPESKPKNIRPKSADCCSAHVPRCHSALHRAFDFSGKQKSGDSLTVSHFTDSSSKLLQNLIEIPSNKTSSREGSILFADCYSKAIRDHKLEEKFLGPESSAEFPKTLTQKLKSDTEASGVGDSDVEHQLGVRGNKVRHLFSEVMEEKTVRFSDSPHLDYLAEKKCHDIECTHFREMFSPRPKSELVLPGETMDFFLRKKTTSGHEEASELETQEKNKKECEVVEVFSSDSEDIPVKKNEKEETETNSEKATNLSGESDSGGHQQAVENSEVVLRQESSLEDVNRINLSLESPVENKRLEEDRAASQIISCEEMFEQPRKREEMNKVSNFNKKVNLSDSTYEEIVQLLQTLEDEDSDSLNLKDKEGSAVDVPTPEVSSSDKMDYFGVVSSYLEELELNDMNSNDNCLGARKWNTEGFSSPRLEELLNKNSVELAHEVFSLKIQVEDQKKGIKLLKEALKEMKEAKKVTELEHQEALQKVNAEAETLVQRHQKFIKQLLNEKNNLNETVSKLVKDLKAGEEKYKKNLKAMEEKHVVEIKRAKETQAVADKIKREKWMEVKTQKIKEMTVKGLEPELSRMAARQQEEMTELRNLHKAEIEAIELRAARRSSDLMDELRAELTKEKERAVAKEIASVRTTMEKDFDEERNRLQQYCQNLKDRLRKQEDKLSNQEQEFKQRAAELKEEEEKKKQKILREHAENTEEIRRQHLAELRNLRESFEAEKEVFMNNYKKQQAAKFFEREAELHQQYKRERDREIEIIIESLENEAAQMQTELNKEAESKLKKLKEKMEAEMKEIEGSEAALKVKLSETKLRLSEKEEFVTELNSQIRQLQTELTFFKKSCEEMTAEKTKVKELIRGEFEENIAGLMKENENLEKEIAACKEVHVRELAKKDQFNVQQKHEMQKELTRVYSRIKSAVSKKERIIESLRQENAGINQRCQQLEVMLDQQRRNLLL